MKELKLKKLIKILDSLVNCRFSYAANQELVIYLSGQKTLAAIFVMKTQAEKIAKYSQVKRQTNHGQTELNNMLKNSVLNEINKEGIFTQGKD